jgi:hypothetical protein
MQSNFQGTDKPRPQPGDLLILWDTCLAVAILEVFAEDRLYQPEYRRR